MSCHPPTEPYSKRIPLEVLDMDDRYAISTRFKLDRLHYFTSRDVRRPDPPIMAVFHFIILIDNIELVTEALDAGTDPNFVDPFGRPTIYFVRSVEMFKLLKTRGVEMIPEALIHLYRALEGYNNPMLDPLTREPAVQMAIKAGVPRSYIQGERREYAYYYSPPGWPGWPGEVRVRDERHTAWYENVTWGGQVYPVLHWLVLTDQLETIFSALREIANPPRLDARGRGLAYYIQSAGMVRMLAYVRPSLLIPDELTQVAHIRGLQSPVAEQIHVLANRFSSS
jgi:hypothetical protein